MELHGNDVDSISVPMARIHGNHMDSVKFAHEIHGNDIDTVNFPIKSMDITWTSWVSSAFP